MTFSEPHIIATMLRNNGVYPGDLQMALIYAYKGLTGSANFAAFVSHGHDNTQFSPWVREPVLLFDSNTGITSEGMAWLDRYGEKGRNMQPFYHRGTILFTATQEVSATELEALLKEKLKGVGFILTNTIQVEEWEEPEAGDPLDLM